jgi:hypothetical protein
MNTVSLKKPFASKEKLPSLGIPINARRPVITPNALLLTQKVHLAPITQQAGELASHAQRANDVPVIFS